MARKVSGDDKRAQVSDKNESKEKQTPKGQSLGACGGLGSLLRLESATHKTCRGNIRAQIKTRMPAENKQTRTHTHTHHHIISLAHSCPLIVCSLLLCCL